MALWIATLLMGVTAAPLAAQSALPMPPAPDRPVPLQPAEGIDSSTGMPGRTLGIEAICGDCQPEIYTSECVGRIEGPNFDSNGNLWMVSPGTGSIFRVTPDGHCEVVAETPGPNGTRYGPDGKLYVTDKTLGIGWIDQDTYEVTFLTNNDGAANFSGLNDLWFDSAGGAYMTDAYGSSVLEPTGRVFYFDPASGEVSKVIGGNLAFPNGIVLSPDERTLYVADWTTNRIIAVPVAAPGELRTEYAWVFAYLNGGRGPDGMTIDTEGNLYVAHYGAGEVVVFDKHGFYYGAIRLPEGAGMVVSNMTIHDGYLYFTEMDRHTVWRVPVAHEGVEVWPAR